MLIGLKFATCNTYTYLSGPFVKIDLLFRFIAENQNFKRLQIWKDTFEDSIMFWYILQGIIMVAPFFLQS